MSDGIQYSIDPVLLAAAAAAGDVTAQYVEAASGGSGEVVIPIEPATFDAAIASVKGELVSTGGIQTMDDLFTGPDINFGAIFQPLISAGVQAATQGLANLFTSQGPPAGPLDLRGLLERTNPLQQIESGASVRGVCKSTSKRRKFKAVRAADGSIQMVSYCAKPRMNVLNPRALGRAARRLGGFQKVAAHIEKVISKSIKTRARRAMPRVHRAGCGCARCK